MNHGLQGMARDEEIIVVAGAEELCQSLLAKGWITIRHTYGHADVRVTTCGAAAVFQILKAGALCSESLVVPRHYRGETEWHNFKRRFEDHLPAGPITSHPPALQHPGDGPWTAVFFHPAFSDLRDVEVASIERIRTMITDAFALRCAVEIKGGALCPANHSRDDASSLTTETAKETANYHNMNPNVMSLPHSVVIYGIIDEACRRFVWTSSTPEISQSLWPLLERRGGAVPTAPKATFKIHLYAQSARVFFYHSGKPIITCALSMSPGGESRALWAWITGAMCHPRKRSKHALPDEPVWAAIAVSKRLPIIAGVDSYELTEFPQVLIGAMVPWLARRN